LRSSKKGGGGNITIVVAPGKHRFEGREWLALISSSLQQDFAYLRKKWQDGDHSETYTPAGKTSVGTDISTSPPTKITNPPQQTPQGMVFFDGLRFLNDYYDVGSYSSEWRAPATHFRTQAQLKSAVPPHLFHFNQSRRVFRALRYIVLESSSAEDKARQWLTGGFLLTTELSAPVQSADVQYGIGIDLHPNFI